MNTTLRHRLLASTLLFGAAAYASPAFAQATPPSSSPDAAEATAEAIEEDAVGEEIVVTGSRIARPDLEQASPIAVIGQEEFQMQAGAANVENVLNDLPQIVATTTGTSNNPGGGVATVNLRGLGTPRTLVLVDGRRYVSFDVNQLIDLNTIPAALIDRVDVVTGGRSAVYGSDAIAGVVNFILRRDFSGFEFGSSMTVTERGDGQIFDVNGTIGTNFADDRGNVTVHVGYVKRKPTFAGERDFSRPALTQGATGPFAGGSGSVPQLRINQAGIGALLGFTVSPTCASANNVDFSPNGSLTCYDAAADAYNFSPINYLQVPQERFLVSAQAQYEVSDLFQPYLEAQFINNRVPNQLAATPIGNSTPFGEGSLGALTVQVNSPFLAPSVRAAFAALDAAETGAAQNNGFISVPSFGFRTVGLGPRRNDDDRNAYRIIAGSRGEIGGGWDYDGYYLYARTKNAQRQSGNIAISNFIAATSTVFQNPTTGATSPFPIAGLANGGTLVCADASARAAGCVPANIFGLGNLSPEAIDYLSIGATNLEEYTTQVASFAITNSSLFDLGAGGIGIALGAEYRSENGSVTPDQFLQSGNVAGFNPGQATSGGYNVKELFAEVNIPLISDSFLHRLELNGAARYSKYSNAPGEVFTWSAGGLLSPIRDITFRGQYQKAIRGPSVSELFLGNTVSFEGNIEFCNTPAALSGTLREICLAQGVPLSVLGTDQFGGPDVNPPTFFGGNPDLLEEEATTWTVGAVFQPSFLPGFSATVDYYNIKVDGFIGTVGTQNIGTACFEEFLQQYCDVIGRNAIGDIERIDDTFANTGGVETRGLDISAGYTHRLGAMMGAEDARIGFSFAGTRLFEYAYTPVQGLDLVIECAGRFGQLCGGTGTNGNPTPKWRHSLRTTLGLGPVRTSLQWRHIGAVDDDDEGNNYIGSEHLEAENYYDLTVGVDVNDHFDFNIGVSNLFDNEPPVGATGQSGGNMEQSNTYPATYDVLGRSFFVSGRLRF